MAINLSLSEGSALLNFIALNSLVDKIFKMTPLDNNMICRKCGGAFSRFYLLEGKRRNACQRKYCFECSPIGKHNTKKLETISVESVVKSTSTCSRCKRVLDISKFYIRPNKNGRLHSICKDCGNILTKERQKALKLKAILYKGGECVQCGYNKSPAALDFHHKDPKEKSFTISSRATAAFSIIRAELDKCILLCSNCHREEHGKKYKSAL